MEKDKLIEVKKSLLVAGISAGISAGLASIMIGTIGCSNHNKYEVPGIVSIPLKYSNLDDYYKYIIQDGESIQLYDSQNVYLLFNKETYEVNEYIYYDKKLDGLGRHTELYDLSSENMVAYCDGIAIAYNEEYYNYLIENNYQVSLTEVGDYIEGTTSKEYYSLAEIRELEPQIAESLKIINATKVKVK